MIFIPAHDHQLQRSLLVLVIEENNFERMKTADPITLESKSRGGLMPVLPYPKDTSLLIAYEADTGPIYEMAHRGAIGEIISHVQRGYKFNSKDGLKWARFLSIKEGES